MYNSRTTINTTATMPLIGLGLVKHKFRVLLCPMFCLLRRLHRLRICKYFAPFLLLSEDGTSLTKGAVCCTWRELIFQVGFKYFISFLQGRSILAHDMLLESRKLCIPLTSPNNVSDTLNNELIYVSGNISTVEVCVIYTCPLLPSPEVPPSLPLSLLPPAPTGAVVWSQ